MENKIHSVMRGLTLNEKDIIYVESRKVFCEGSVEHSRHPGVFLKIPENDKENKIRCPYCGQIFLYKSK